MSETKLSIIKVGNYSQSTSADPQDCKVCHDAKWGTVIIDGVCAECLLAELSRYKAMVEWIPVTTRLPELPNWVTVWNENNPKDQPYPGYCACGVWYDDDGCEISKHMLPTHWLPLPPSPESEK
jgi:hypothetical protein